MQWMMEDTSTLALPTWPKQHTHTNPNTHPPPPPVGGFRRRAPYQY